MNKDKTDVLVEDLLNDMFTAGHTNEVVERLVLVSRGGATLGGWSKDVVRGKLLRFAVKVADAG